MRKCCLVVLELFTAESEDVLDPVTLANQLGDQRVIVTFRIDIDVDFRIIHTP